MTPEEPARVEIVAMRIASGSVHSRSEQTRMSG